MKRNITSENVCPLCGKGGTHLTKIAYSLKNEDGKEITIPEVEVEVCDYCGERIFNMEAVRKARKIVGTPAKISVRLKPELLAALAKRARKSKRSITEEAQRLIEESLHTAK